jgi:hypothetical protein
MEPHESEQDASSQDYDPSLELYSSCNSTPDENGETQPGAVDNDAIADTLKQLSEGMVRLANICSQLTSNQVQEPDLRSSSSSSRWTTISPDSFWGNGISKGAVLCYRFANGHCDRGGRLDS